MPHVLWPCACLERVCPWQAVLSSPRADNCNGGGGGGTVLIKIPRVHPIFIPSCPTPTCKCARAQKFQRISLRKSPLCHFKFNNHHHARANQSHLDHSCCKQPNICHMYLYPPLHHHGTLRCRSTRLTSAPPTPKVVHIRKRGTYQETWHISGNVVHIRKCGMLTTSDYGGLTF